MVKKLKKQLNAQELVIKYIAEKFVKGNLGRNVSDFQFQPVITNCFFHKDFMF